MKWEQRYRDRDIPWDKGESAPVLRWFLEQEKGRIPGGSRVLVPGCGRGHDACLLAGSGFFTTGLDLSPTAIEQAGDLYTHPGLQWRIGDLFRDLPEERFDAVWEHTCYCAIPPPRRPDYVQAMHRTLKPGGKLLGIFLLESGGDPDDGPPFGTTVEEITKIFQSVFILEAEWVPPIGFPGREGREHLMLWRRG